jgi:hypothetical protein
LALVVAVRLGVELKKELMVLTRYFLQLHLLVVVQVAHLLVVVRQEIQVVQAAVQVILAVMKTRPAQEIHQQHHHHKETMVAVQRKQVVVLMLAAVVAALVRRVLPQQLTV